ncbi:hypothetical protein Tco_1246209, partial [Tanacetum coccineum]
LYFTMRTCPPRVFESAQRSFDVALRSSLVRIVTASGPGFCDWQWRLATLPFAFGGLGVYSAGDVLNYAFLASRLQFTVLQTKLLWHTGIVSPGPIFDDALSVLNTSMETDLLSNPNEITAPKLMKKMTDIYFTRVTKNAESKFSLSPRQMTFLVQPVQGFLLGIFTKTMLCRARELLVLNIVITLCMIPLSTYVVVLGFQLVKKLISGWMRDKPLRPADMLLYSWDRGLDVCVNLTGSSPLTQTGMVEFVPGRAVINAAQRKCGKYMDKCATIGYGFLPFSFSSLGELEVDAVTLLKRIRKLSITQDIGARAAIHIFNRISFAIAKGVGAQIVSRRPSNLLAICTFSPGGMDIDFDIILALNINFVENSMLLFEETQINVNNNNPGINQIDDLNDEFETIDLNDDLENMDLSNELENTDLNEEFENYISDEDLTFDRYEWTTSDYTYDDTDWHYNSS